MNSPFAIIFPAGDDESGGFPRFKKCEDTDKWPDAAVTEKAFRTVLEIMIRGYTGVKVEAFPLGERYYAFDCNPDMGTPEGRLSEHIFDLASKGKTISTRTALSILERVYKEQGRPLPGQGLHKRDGKGRG